MIAQIMHGVKSSNHGNRSVVRGGLCRRERWGGGSHDASLDFPRTRHGLFSRRKLEPGVQARRAVLLVSTRTTARMTRESEAANFFSGTSNRWLPLLLRDSDSHPGRQRNETPSTTTVCRWRRRYASDRGSFCFASFFGRVPINRAPDIIIILAITLRYHQRRGHSGSCNGAPSLLASGRVQNERSTHVEV